MYVRSGEGRPPQSTRSIGERRVLNIPKFLASRVKIIIIIVIIIAFFLFTSLLTPLVNQDLKPISPRE